MKTIIWYQHDLRVDDHLPLQAALQYDDEIEGHYFINEQDLQINEYQVIPLGARRLQFLKETLEELAGSLAAFGIPLYINLAHPLDVLNPEDRLLFQQSVGVNERLLASHVVSQWKGEWQSYDGFTLYTRKEIPFEKMPFLFTDFRKKMETINEPELFVDRRVAAESQPVLLPIQFKPPAVDPRSAFPFRGGERAGWQRMRDYLEGPIRTYKETRNGFNIEDSSKLSAYLANGSLSPRRVFHELKQHEQNKGANESTYWLFFELLWRDFFQWNALEQGVNLFRLHGSRTKQKDWQVDRDIINNWIDGETGADFVDAFMRELKQTGWMSNRGRQIVANYFSKELNQDWRYGAAYFESQLIDYDVASNYGNWAYQAGVGNDPRNRRMDVSWQKKIYDPDGDFCATWL